MARLQCDFLSRERQISAGLMGTVLKDLVEPLEPDATEAIQIYFSSWLRFPLPN